MYCPNMEESDLTGNDMFKMLKEEWERIKKGDSIFNYQKSLVRYAATEL